MMLIVDSFAGGGGASVAIRMALGRSPDIAINHDGIALGMHEANHPGTLHLPENVWQVDLDDHVRGQTVGLLWASPDCRHFSKARGGAPTSRSVRGLAWTIVKFVKQLKQRKPRVIVMENVEEFLTWEDYPEWSRQLKRHGYSMRSFQLRACDFGAPTIRKRLFIVMRCDGQPIVEPEPTHGAPDDPRVLAGKLQSWRTAAEIVDWSIPCPSIFDTSDEIMRKYGVRAVRPLAENTLKRVAMGVKRYVIDAAEPFIVKFQTGSVSEPLHTVTANSDIKQPGGCAPIGVAVPTLVGCGGRAGQSRPRGGDEPTATCTTKADVCLSTTTLLQTGHIQRDYGNSVGHGADDPIATITAGGGGKVALVSTFLAQHNTGVVGHSAEKPVSTIVGRGSTQAVVAAHLSTMRNAQKPFNGAGEPTHTITAGGAGLSLVAAHMLSLKGADRRDGAVTDPHPTICAGGTHAAMVSAFMVKYYGNDGATPMSEPVHTVTTRDRFGLVTVTVDGKEYAIVDIGMRMLTPRELFNAQGFPADYIIDRQADGTPITKTQQIHKCGNSVSPQPAAAVLRANCAGLAFARRAA